ncbi:MAG: YfhO family protein, partial [Frankia sp.]
DPIPIPIPNPNPTRDSVVTTHLGETTVDLKTTSSARSLLVLPDPYYPQWQVTVDGKRASVLAVDEAFRGVVVPAGTHTVRFAYVDTRLRVGVGLAGVTLVGLFGVTALSPLVRRRRRGSETGQPDPDPDPEA